MTGGSPRRRGAFVAACALGLSLVTAACNDDANSVASQAMAGDGKGYVAGDGTVEQLAVADRGAAVSLGGTTVDGKSWSTAADAPGKVVVVNVWGSWCAPCVDETPHLQQVWQSYSTAGKPVAFVGIDIKESAATAAAFLKANSVTYPSLSDSGSGGQPMLALQGKAAATPSTLVLDRQGRIAACVLGATTVSTLTGLVDDVLAEQA
ncbi:MAG TPA: TlpA disulfide reductase family protein [Lapillicoccus sp.]|nr:TlpA disulfide reductase family protein [Lapillicoccus sp.]